MVLAQLNIGGTTVSSNHDQFRMVHIVPDLTQSFQSQDHPANLSQYIKLKTEQSNIAIVHHDLNSNKTLRLVQSCFMCHCSQAGLEGSDPLRSLGVLQDLVQVRALQKEGKMLCIMLISMPSHFSSTYSCLHRIFSKLNSKECASSLLHTEQTRFMRRLTSDSHHPIAIGCMMNFCKGSYSSELWAFELQRVVWQAWAVCITKKSQQSFDHVLSLLQQGCALLNIYSGELARARTIWQTHACDWHQSIIRLVLHETFVKNLQLRQASDSNVKHASCCWSFIRPACSTVFLATEHPTCAISSNDGEAICTWAIDSIGCRVDHSIIASVLWWWRRCSCSCIYGSCSWWSCKMHP